MASGDRFVSFKAGGDPLKNINVSPFQSSMILMHDYCFLPFIWPQVINLFPSKQTGIAEMTVSFSIAWGIAWPEGRSDKKKSHKKIVLLLVFLVVGE